MSLPCDIESLQDDSPLRIRWFKDGQDAPNYIAEDVLKRGECEGTWDGQIDRPRELATALLLFDLSVELTR